MNNIILSLFFYSVGTPVTLTDVPKYSGCEAKITDYTEDKDIYYYKVELTSCSPGVKLNGLKETQFNVSQK